MKEEIMIILKQLIRNTVGLIVFSATLMAIDIPELPKEMGITKALYINCLQRTQTQQLFKEYLMVGLSSSYKNPKKGLADAIVKYDKRIHQFDEYFKPLLSSHPKEQKQVADALVIWKESKILLETTPTKDNAVILEKNFIKIVKLLGKAKVLAKKSFAAVGMTGGLCRDPLYMANVYLMKIWGIDMPDYKKKMEKYIAHFNSNLAKLKDYKGNNEETNRYIKDSERAFMFFTFSYDSESVSIPTLISKKADKIFTNISTLKKLYGAMPH